MSASPSQAAHESAPGLPEHRQLSEELIAQGVPPAQANHMTVQRNLHIALEASFRQCGRAWLCSSFLLVLGALGLVMWSENIYNEHATEYCDQPFALMLRALYVIVAVIALQREIIRCFLCHTNTGGRAPLRVRLFRRASYSSALLWPLVATWMLSHTQTCSSELKRAVFVLTVYYLIVCSVVVVLPAFTIGVAMCLVRRGLIRAPRPSQAAPENFITQLPVVKYEPNMFDDNTPGCFPSACPICLDQFNAERPISRTPCASANHAFHQDCLKGWLECARTCPLCRTDLVETEATGSGV